MIGDMLDTGRCWYLVKFPLGSCFNCLSQTLYNNGCENDVLGDMQ